MALTVVVASANPIKLGAVRGAFQKMFPERKFLFDTAPTPSGVPDQPIGDDETLLGAWNRAKGASNRRPDADFWVGVEGGIAESESGMIAFAWIVIRSPEREGKSRSASFFLPESVVKLVRSGLELGEADDRVFGVSDSKHKDGAVGMLTGKVITRTDLYEHAAIMALIPFLKPDIYPSDNQV